MATVAIRNCKFIPALTEGTDLVEGDLLFCDGVIAKIAACGADFVAVDQENRNFCVFDCLNRAGCIQIELSVEHSAQADQRVDQFDRHSHVCTEDFFDDVGWSVVWTVCDNAFNIFRKVHFGGHEDSRGSHGDAAEDDRNVSEALVCVFDPVQDVGAL